jgi:transcriptional regulator with XRE-family HTH domain
MNLGKTIKFCRKIKGLTQAQLADKVDISISHICLLESGKREPALTKLEAIAEALEIPLSVLVFLAAKDEGLDKLSKSQVEDLSNSILGLMDVTLQQKTLF